MSTRINSQRKLKMQQLIITKLCKSPLVLTSIFFNILFKLLSVSVGTIILLLIVLNLTSQTEAASTITNSSEIEQGSLVVQNKHGHFDLIPLLDTQVNIKITGLIARIKVRQFFQNQSQDTIEASYLFPLPDDSAVDHLSMMIGERHIVGEIKEKSEAKKIYQQARAAGKKTALLEQKRANIFKTHVANIGQGEVVEILIEYQQLVEYRSGEFSIRFPTAITPRYNRGDFKINETITERFDSKNNSSWGSVSESNVIVPVEKDKTGQENSIHIDIELNAGLAIKTIQSPYHQIIRQKQASGIVHVSLKNYQVSDRDFELRWRPEDSAMPRLATFTEPSMKDSKEDYLLLMVMPPQEAGFEALPRELTLVVDTSGSMEGASMEQAILALQQVLGNLSKEDRFNIIAFNHQTRRLFEGLKDVSSYSKSAAQKFIRSLIAEGGTEMLPAHELALNEASADGYVRQIVFLTDGAVSYEDEMFQVINSSLGGARLFTIGIGSAPNSYFMRKAAQFGRGTYTYIGKPEEVEEKMHTLFEKLEQPVMQNIQLSWPGKVEQFPKLIPDLYLGEPLVVRAKLDQSVKKSGGEVQISGERGTTLWQASIPMMKLKNSAINSASSYASKGVGVLWARSKISELLDEHIHSPRENDARQQIIEVALEHHLVSRYTSLVAVEQKVTAAVNGPLKSATISNHLPAGSRGQAFGYPSTATGWRLELFFGVLLLVSSLLIYLAALFFEKRAFEK